MLGVRKLTSLKQKIEKGIQCDSIFCYNDKER